jgi:GntR family transcriptional regulator
LLKVERGAVVVVRRRTMVDRETEAPNELVNSFYPAEIALGTPLAERGLLRGGSPDELARLGFPPGPATEWVYARMPTAAELEALGLRPNFPVFRIVRQVRTEQGRPVEVLEMVMSAERYVMRYEL